MNPTAISSIPSLTRPAGVPRALAGDTGNPAIRSPRPRTVGLLAIQGDFDLHRQAVRNLGYQAREVRTLADLAGVDCLIMPGGESTTMRKLMVLNGLFDAIPRFAKDHAIMATCAGLILLSNGIEGSPDQVTLGLVDCKVSRNSYGRQYHSFRQAGSVRWPGVQSDFEMVFIRAPRITHLGGSVEILGRLDDEPTLIRQGNILAMTFHPELAGDERIHDFFLNGVATWG